MAAAIGADSREALTELGRLLAALRAPQPPQQHRRGLAGVAAAQGDPEHGAACRSRRGVPGEVMEGDAVDLGRLAHSDLLAGGRRTADHLGPDDDARAAARPAEPRDLSPAGHRPQPHDHALAAAPRRRDGLSARSATLPGRAVSGGRRARRRSGDDPGRRDTHSEHIVGVRVRGAAARPALRGREVPGLGLLVPASAEITLEGYIAPGDEAPRGRSAITPATTTKSSGSR